MSRSETTAGTTGTTTVEFTLSVKVTKGVDGVVNFSVSSEPSYALIEDRARAMLPGDIQLEEGCKDGEITLHRNGQGFEELVVGVSFGQEFKDCLVGLVNDGFATFGNLENSLKALGKTGDFMHEVVRITTLILANPALLAQLGEMEMKAAQRCPSCNGFHEEDQDVAFAIGGNGKSRPDITAMIRGSARQWLQGRFGKAVERIFGLNGMEAEEPQKAPFVFHVNPRIAGHVFFEACGGMPRVKEMAIEAVQGMLVEKVVTLDGLLMSGHELLVETRELLMTNHEHNLRQLAMASDSAARAATDLTAKAAALSAAGLVLPALVSGSLIEHGDARDSAADGNGTDGQANQPDTAISAAATDGTTASPADAFTEVFDGTDGDAQAAGTNGDDGMVGDGLPNTAHVATSGAIDDSTGDEEPAPAPIIATA